MCVGATQQLSIRSGPFARIKLAMTSPAEFLLEPKTFILECMKPRPVYVTQQ